MLKELREFAVKGNVVDMAVGIILGTAFTAVVQSLVNDIAMPPLGVVTGGLDFTNQFVVLAEGAVPGPYESLEAARSAGAAVVAWGQLLNRVVSFSLIAIVLFFAVRWINRLRRPSSPPAPHTKPCPYCRSSIDAEATRCPQCTSEVAPRSSSAPSA